MSTHKICTIHDTKAEIFFSPYLYRSSAEFIRVVQTEAKNKESMLHKFPSDYDLYVLGDWSETEASIQTLPVKQRLGSVLDLCPLN